MWPAKTQIGLYIHPVWQGFSFISLWISWSCRRHMQSGKSLVRLCGCAGWSESSLIAQVLCRFFRALAHSQIHQGSIIILSLYYCKDVKFHMVSPHIFLQLTRHIVTWRWAKWVSQSLSLVSQEQARPSQQNISSSISQTAGEHMLDL